LKLEIIKVYYPWMKHWNFSIYMHLLMCVTQVHFWFIPSLVETLELELSGLFHQRLKPCCNPKYITQ
jgi:hypothetical protein